MYYNEPYTQTRGGGDWSMILFYSGGEKIIYKQLSEQQCIKRSIYEEEQEEATAAPPYIMPAWPSLPLRPLNVRR